ncbi:MAG: hypothetical protein Q4D77_07600 [Peptostreptococcaceae bacterium]|nr:hypothetical protein [Peptostreptococcaceae bacterium]
MLQQKDLQAEENQIRERINDQKREAAQSMPEYLEVLGRRQKVYMLIGGIGFAIGVVLSMIENKMEEPSKLLSVFAGLGLICVLFFFYGGYHWLSDRWFRKR